MIFMAEEEKKSCRGCRFAIPLPSPLVGSWVAECRKNPPQLILLPQGPALAFPQVNETLFCFGHEPLLKVES